MRACKRCNGSGIILRHVPAGTAGPGVCDAQMCMCRYVEPLLSYVDDDGCEVMAAACGGEEWMWASHRRNPHTRMLDQIEDAALPMRQTREEAEADLEEYAAKNGWRKA